MKTITLSKDDWNDVVCALESAQYEAEGKADLYRGYEREQRYRKEAAGAARVKVEIERQLGAR